MAETGWRWERGKVDVTREHMEIAYGDVRAVKPDTFVPIAVVAPPEAGKFAVQFKVDSEDDTRHMVEAVRRELDFYLAEKGEEDPWAYAKYQCSTASNVYSNVHWTYLPNGRNPV